MSARSDPLLVAVVGPTGSGKSSLALRMAGALDGEIVNCDSLQLYRHFDIGSAKTPPGERLGIPHHLMDVLNPDQVFSAGEYSRRGRVVIREIALRGKVPVVVGGTGFYLRALLEGLVDAPKADPKLRERLVNYERRRPGLLHRWLRRRDPLSASRIHAKDTQKLVRAVEICVLTGQRLSSWLERARDPLTGFRVVKVGLDPPRTELYARLNQRCRQMFEAGLVAEVEGILARGYSPESKPFEALGYKEALAVALGRMEVEAAIAQAQIETRHYAKRQRTWFRRDPEIRWILKFGSDAEWQPLVGGVM